MKKIISSCLFLILLSGLSLAQPSIEIKGLAAQSYYINIMPGGLSCPQYLIWLEIKNQTKQDLIFDTMMVYWVCQGGMMGSATLKTAAADSTLPGDFDPFNQRHESFVVKSGATLDFNYNTNGYTGDLLDNKHDKPVYFVFLLLSKKGIVAGPFMAELPNLADLPKAKGYDYIDPQETGLFKLNFKTGVPQY